MSGLWSVRKLGVKQGNLTLGFLFFQYGNIFSCQGKMGFQRCSRAMKSLRFLCAGQLTAKSPILEKLTNTIHLIIIFSEFSQRSCSIPQPSATCYPFDSNSTVESESSPEFH
jgi:hypothetical protein